MRARTHTVTSHAYSIADSLATVVQQRYFKKHTQQNRRPRTMKSVQKIASVSVHSAHDLTNMLTLILLSQLVQLLAVLLKSRVDTIWTTV